MADLVNLHVADKFFTSCRESLEQNRKLLQGLKTVSPEEMALLWGLFNTMTHLTNGLMELVNNNRDGRGAMHDMAWKRKLRGLGD